MQDWSAITLTTSTFPAIDCLWGKTRQSQKGFFACSSWLRVTLLFLRAQVGVQDELFLFFAALALGCVVRLAHYTAQLRALRFFTLELLQVCIVVGVEDEQVLVCHSGVWILGLDDRSQERRMSALIDR